MNNSIIKPLRPTNYLWMQTRTPPSVVAMGFPAEAWLLPNFDVTVISAVEVAKDKDGIERGPEYHISVAQQGPTGPTRIPLERALTVLHDFGNLDGWEEDNHVPGGVVRNFWRPVAEPMIGLDCACKDAETVVVEGDYEHRPLPTTD